jgi:hypothetical protein
MNTLKAITLAVLLVSGSIAPSAFALFLLPNVTGESVATTTTATTTATAELATSTQEQLVTDRWFTSDFVIGDPLVGDFVVGPGRVELNMKPGETVVTEITVTNRISENREFLLEVSDVAGTSDGSSALNLVEGGAPGPYSIREFVSFKEPTFNLALGERARIPVTITLPPNITPGGLYGTVLVSTVQAPNTPTGANVPRNPIIARVGSHIFINIEGEKVVSGEVLGIDVLPSKLWHETGPFNFAISYDNDGSVHLNPYGEISVRNMFGQEVGYVQLEPWFVLPASLRTREIEWDRGFLFGRYTAVAQINRGYGDIVDEVQVSFWVLPWKIMAAVFGSLFLILFVFRLFFRTFEFKRK